VDVFQYRILRDGDETMSVQEGQRKEVRIFFNEEPIIAPKEFWTGAELREFLNVRTEWGMFAFLYKEEPGKPVDTLISPDTSVRLKDGDKFYDIPMGIKG
jgi:hypothetical protein